MENFTPISGLIGGILIGLAASFLLYYNGRICGISGIYGRIFDFRPDESYWRLSFVLGLICGGILTRIFFPGSFDFEITESWPIVIVGGFLVGFGTNFGHGCTSGHGVCGVGRLSKRSIIATFIFLFFGILTATLKGVRN